MRLLPVTAFLCACEGAIALPVVNGPANPDTATVTAPVTCTPQLLAEPGRVTIRRLNRYEYNATVRDLLGDTTQPAQNFPADDFGRGFDNLGEVLSTSPLLVELWQGAAETLADTVLTAELVAGQSTRVAADTMVASAGGANGGG